MEGDRANSAYKTALVFISIHALRVEGDADVLNWGSKEGISIHALRVEGDLYHMPPTN